MRQGGLVAVPSIIPVRDRSAQLNLALTVVTGSEQPWVFNRCVTT
jgi:hypothetical protein